MRVTIFDGMQALTTSTEPVGSFEVRPSATTEYRLAAESDVATTDARLTVRVAGAERPRIRSFSVDPITIVGEGAVTVAWDSERADSLLLEANGDVVPNFPSSPTGSLGLRVSTTTTFRLVARNVAGDAVAEQLVTVTPIPDGTPPVLDHTPPGASVVDGASVTLDVGVTDAESGVGMVSVQHRVRGEAGFTTAPMTPRGGRWVVDLPAAAVRAPGLEYAFEALDRAATPNRARLPAMPAELFTLDVVAPDLTPPTITVAPIANGQLAGRPITIRATVRDAASGVGSVTLYHRAAGAPTYTSRVMMPGAADEYTADIPAAAVVVGTVEYYVSAADGAVPTNRASFPSGAPATALSFTVVSIDQTPPVIQHVPVPNAQTAGGAVPVAAQVVDASGVARVTLFFRTIGAGAYTSVALVDGGGNFSGQIPASAVSPPGVEYYLEAADLAPASNVARAPSSAPATPYTFTAQVADTTPPSITHAAQATPQAPGTALVVRATVTDASPLASVTLFYRRAGQTTFQSLAMTGAPMASATIPASEVEPPGLEYYLRAQDAAPAMNVAAAPASAPQTTFAVPVGVAEVEPNQTTASALALLPAGRLETVGLGAISPTADRDLWMLDVPTGAQRYNVRLETTSGGVGSCPSPIATTLRLYASDGTTQLAVDSTDGVNSCSLLDPAVDAGVRALAPGRYFVRVEENGDNAVIAAYELRVRLSLPACGNGILEPSGPEQCDDANQASGDGCSATCTIEPEGVIAAPGGTFAGDISPAGDADLVAVDVPAGSFLRAELTDAAGTGCPGDLYLELYGLDGVTLLGQDDDDGTGSCSLVNPLTDTWARALPAGRYFLRVRAFSASAMIMGWVLRVSALPTLCGNGVRESGEQCDDNNLTANDGCSATCAFESAGAFSMTGGSASESITPIGNRDFFQVTVQAGESLRAETSAPTPGTCTTGVDTVLRFWNADRTTELTSDDEGGVGSCSLLDPAASAALRGLAAGTYWVSVEDRGNNGTIAGYTLSITLRAPGCGSGVLDAGEQCDDGNTTPNDGCSATCQLEGNGELEPNDTRATATPLLTGGATSGVILGSGQSASDVDVYSVDVPAGSSLFAEVSDGQGGCPSGTALRLVGPTGTSLVFDTDGGPGSFGQISPSRHVAARALAAGLYTLEVSGASSPAVYRLEVRLTAPGCGDFALAAAEACDDGNTTSGDGCSATCALEGRAELEPNDTSMTAQTLTLTATGAEVRGVLRSSFDVDTFRVAVPAGSTLIAELSDGAGRCPNAAGLRMAPTTGFTGGSDASSGYGSCGRISPGLQAWIRVIPSGDQFVQVYAPTPSTTTAVYVLTVRVVPLATCGNGYWESGEQCDDGNTTRRAAGTCSSRSRTTARWRRRRSRARACP
jgi:cysteine-rich repeat protein